MSQHPPKAAHWHQWTEHEARDVLARLDRSNLSTAAFAKRAGISAHRIQYWRDKLAATAPSSTTPFIPVRVHTRQSIKITLDAVALELAADTAAERIAEIVVAVAAAHRGQRSC